LKEEGEELEQKKVLVVYTKFLPSAPIYWRQAQIAPPQDTNEVVVTALREKMV
jgi:hypothetical protein